LRGLTAIGFSITCRAARSSKTLRLVSEWTPEELDPESDQIRQVYAMYGAAMYFAQVLEHGLANFVVASRASQGLKSRDAADALWDELFSSTMGQQLREALAEARLDEVLIARLRKGTAST